MSRRRSSGRTTPSSSRTSRSRSRSSRRGHLEEMSTMLHDTYEAATAKGSAKHYGSLAPPIRDVYEYEDDPRTRRTSDEKKHVKRNLKRKKKLWEEFLEQYPETLRDDPSLSKEEELQRRQQLYMAEIQRKKQ